MSLFSNEQQEMKASIKYYLIQVIMISRECFSFSSNGFSGRMVEIIQNLSSLQVEMVRLMFICFLISIAFPEVVPNEENTC